MRAVGFANTGEERARGRCIDELFAREVAGDPAHPDGELGDLDDCNQSVEDGRGIDPMHSGIGMDL